MIGNLVGGSAFSILQGAAQGGVTNTAIVNGVVQAGAAVAGVVQGGVAAAGVFDKNEKGRAVGDTGGRATGTGDAAEANKYGSTGSGTGGDAASAKTIKARL